MKQSKKPSRSARRRFLRVAGGIILTHASGSRVVGLHGEGQTSDAKGGNLVAKGSRIKVAQIKVVPKKGELESNHRLLMAVLRDLGKGPGVDVVVTPEGFLDGYVSTEEQVTADTMIQYAIDLKASPYVQAVAEWARKNHCWFVLGCTRLENACAYNTAAIIDRQGQLVGSYDKLHLQKHDHKYRPGNQLDVYESDFGPFGVMICADRRWPETVRTLALKGARVIFNPTYGMHNDLNLALMRTRAYESELFIVFTHPKQTLITDPEGNVVTNDEHVSHRYVVTEIDLAAVDARRASPMGHLKDRRTDVYLVDNPTFRSK